MLSSSSKVDFITLLLGECRRYKKECWLLWVFHKNGKSLSLLGLTLILPNCHVISKEHKLGTKNRTQCGLAVGVDQRAQHLCRLWTTLLQWDQKVHISQCTSNNINRSNTGFTTPCVIENSNEEGSQWCSVTLGSLNSIRKSSDKLSYYEFI